MKKLQLRALELGAKEVLTRDQLKKIMGGDSGSEVENGAAYGYCPLSNQSWHYVPNAPWNICLDDLKVRCAQFEEGICSAY